MYSDDEYQDEEHLEDEIPINYDIELGSPDPEVTTAEEDPIALEDAKGDDTTDNDAEDEVPEDDKDDAAEEEAGDDEQAGQKYRFSADFYVKNYTRQKTGICINSKKNVPEIVSGNTLPEVLQCVWTIVKPFLCREVDVSEANGIEVSWSPKMEPDIRDIEKFVWLKDVKRRMVHKLDGLGEGRMLLGWRNKQIMVFAFAYSQSISSLAIWEKLNKVLLQPSDCDRSGAPSNVELDNLVQELKDKNSHLEAHDSAWIQWATFIHSSPANVQDRLKVQLPPASMRGMFWALPTSEGSRLESTGQGLLVAENMLENLAPAVKVLMDCSNRLMDLAFEMKTATNSLNDKLDMCRSMIEGMKMTAAPEESILSQTLRNNVGDMVDMDHT